jgi:hypothetical protein
MQKFPEKLMQQTIHCRRCKRPICETDREEICFEILGNRVCVMIRGKFESVKCACGQVTKISKTKIA